MGDAGPQSVLQMSLPDTVQDAACIIIKRRQNKSESYWYP